MERRERGCPIGECVVYPLFYLEADLPGDSYDFDFGVSLVRATEEAVAAIYTQTYNFRFPSEEPKWLLAARFFPHAQAADAYSSFQYELASGFLAALNLVNANTAIAPTLFHARRTGSAALEIEGEDGSDYAETSFEQRISHWPEPLRENKIDLLRRVWSSLVDLIYSKPLSCEPDGKYGEAITWQPPYFERFAWMGGGTILAKKRLGRALGLFELGSHLPLCAGFIMMFTVLESLYVAPDASKETHVKATISRRVAAALGGKNGNKRSEYWERMRRAYKTRSDVVHGLKLVTDIRGAEQRENMRSAFDFARKSLQLALTDSGLYAAYTDDDKDELRLKKYFLKWDKNTG